MIEPQVSEAIAKLGAKSVFAGHPPEVLLLVEGNLPTLTRGRSVARSVQALCDGLTMAKCHQRLAIGFGRLLFKDAPPACLAKPLSFNFDERWKVDLSSRDILLAAEVSLEQLGSLLAVVTESGLLDKCLVKIGMNTPSKRGHLGFIDGTSNLQEFSAAEFDAVVRVSVEQDREHAGGGYVVIRSYREEVELWHQLPTTVREQFIGRKLDDGTFLDGACSFSHDTWESTPACAHVRCANPRGTMIPNLSDQRMYRRSIPYTARNADGSESRGLIFIALASDPVAQIESIHNNRMLPRTSERDLLLSSGYVVPERMACYYILPCFVPSQASNKC